MNHVERILNKADDHAQAMAELEQEAARSGRRLTEEEQSYVAELEDEHQKIMDAASRASRNNALGKLGQTVVMDTSGTILTEADIVEAAHSATKTPTAGGGRLAD